MFIKHIFPASLRAEIQSSKGYSKEELSKFKEKLPNGILSLGLVISRSMAESERFKQVASAAYSVKTPEFSARAPFDTRLSISQTWANDKSDRVNSFGATKSESSGLSATLSRQFSTGTVLSTTLYQNRTEVSYPASVTSFGPYETNGSISLSQNLWADAFGKASRRALESAALTSQSRAYGLSENIEQWAIEIVNTYYGAWLYQAQAKAANESLSRKNRLLKVTRLRSQRGNAERPDVLQVEASVLKSQADAMAARRSIDDLWRELIINLKFPADMMNIDSLEIPLKLDDVEKTAAELCHNFRTRGVPDRETTTLLKATSFAKATRLEFEKSQSEAWPDLKLFGTYTVNGFDRERDESFVETTNSEHPGWTVGLTLSMPFEFSLQKAQLSASKSQNMFAEAAEKIAQDERNLAWLNECDNFARLTKTRDLAEKAFQNQSTRADLEEKRFQVGRTNTFNVIQAGDDSTLAEVQWRSTEVQLRASAWQILLLNNSVIERLKSYISTFGTTEDLTKFESLGR